jgi:hypothetical protein
MKMQSSNIMAVVYTDGLAADKFLAGWGYRLRAAGLSVAGLVQLNTFERDPGKCDMAVEELYSGTVLQLSEDRGKGSSGCRLDRSILMQASVLLLRALENKLDVLVLNKFGKVEAEGQGLRDVLGKAVELGVAVVVGVPFRNLDQWRIFAGDLAEECSTESKRLKDWLSSRGLLVDPPLEIPCSSGSSADGPVGVQCEMRP